MKIKERHWESVWDNGLTIRLLMKFLKKHGIAHRIYEQFCEQSKNKHNLWFWSGVYPSIYSVGGVYLAFACPTKIGERYPQKDLVLAQLWRFEVIANIEEYKHICPSHSIDLYNSIKSAIILNGNRGSEEVKTLFEKYNFKPYRQ